MPNLILKEAIAWLTPFNEDIIITPDHIKAVNMLIEMAQLFLQVEQDGVEKIYLDDPHYVFGGKSPKGSKQIQALAYQMNEARNAAIDLCQADLARKLEGMGRVIEKNAHILYEADAFGHTHTIDFNKLLEALTTHFTNQERR